MLYFFNFKTLFNSKITLILTVDANFALHCIQTQIGYSMNISCLFIPMLLKERLHLTPEILAAHCFIPN